MATSNKRDRQLAAAKEQRRKARLAEQARRKRRQQIIAVALVLGLVLALTGGFLLSTLLGGNNDDTASGGDASTDAGATDAQPVASCREAGELTDTAKTYPAAGDGGVAGAALFTFQTNCGDIVVQADAAAAPQTVNSMAFLAKDGYFNNTLCHRLTTEGIFVLQCGDPTASGSGGPGYALAEENLPAASERNYPAGTVAMANAGAGTTGSQFFIVYQDSTLPPNYTVWGTVTTGLDIVTQVAAAGTADGGTDGAPAQAVMIEAVTVSAQ